MTIQYPNALDKSRKVCICMDHTSGKDKTIYRTIINTLKKNGITNIVENGIGPNTLYNNMLYVYNQHMTNAILVHVANGIDPTNVNEVGLPGPNGEWGAKWGNDNRGRITRSRGNDAVIALFYDACDPTRPSGTCYNKIRTRNPRTDVVDGGYWPTGEKPMDYCRRNKIYMVNRSSNEHNKNNSSFDYKSIADYTGEKIGQAIADLFTEGQPGEATTTTTTPTVTPTPTDNTGEVVKGDTTKTIATKVITKSYTFPYYERTYKLKTDHLGAFSLLHTLPYQGEYKILMKFGGDKTHQSSTKSIKVRNYSSKAQIFKETLLHTETTIKYTDNTVDTQSTGKLPENNKYIKKVQTTETYENGVLKSKTEKTLYMSDILKEADKQEISIDTITPTNVNTDDFTKQVTSNNAANPFSQVIPVKTDGSPNLSMMITGGKSYVDVDWNKSYTLTKAQYQAVMQRDSRTMQINGYKVSKYTAFESTDTKTYNVVKRETWNMLEESLYHYRVWHAKGFPDSVTFDFKNRTTTCGGITEKWKGNGPPHDYNWTGCNIHFVADGQRHGHSCGPTSASVCTAVLHNYYSERDMDAIVKSNKYGSGPVQLRDALQNKGFGSSTYSTNKTTALAELDAGKPTIWHIDNHYFCLAHRTPNGRVLVSNSAGEGSGKYNQYGKSTSGWHDSSDITGAYGQAVKVWLKYSMTTQEIEQLKNFLASMGGSWSMPNTTEYIRKSSYGT